MQDGFLSVHHQRMPGVMPALKTHHALGVIRQPIDDLAFALISPLGADYHHIFCHARYSLNFH